MSMAWLMLINLLAVVAGVVFMFVFWSGSDE